MTYMQIVISREAAYETLKARVVVAARNIPAKAQWGHTALFT